MIGVTNKLKYVLPFILLLGSTLVNIQLVNAQDVEKEAVRLTGIILDADNRMAVPYASIRIAGTQFGTSSDSNGAFNIFMSPGDTLIFTSVGYREATFIMPYTVKSDAYSLIQLMRKESLLLEEVVVFPWPTLQNFENAFLDVKPKTDKMRDLVTEVKRELKRDVNMSRESEFYYDQMRYQRLYEINGDFRPNNFLNPMRWSNFINEVTSGNLKQKEEEEED